MRIAVPREIKDSEGRVAITPSGVHELVRHGHQVGVETGAGAGASISDADFAAAGATVLPDAAATWEFGELILKVKEPVPAEYRSEEHTSELQSRGQLVCCLLREKKEYTPT